MTVSKRKIAPDLLRPDGPIAQLCLLALASSKTDLIEFHSGKTSFACDAVRGWTALAPADCAGERPPGERLSIEVRWELGRRMATLSFVRRTHDAFEHADQVCLNRTAGLIAELIGRHRDREIVAHSLRRERQSRQRLREQAQELWRRQAIFEQTERLARVGGWTTDLRTNEMTWTDEIYRISELPIGKSVSVERALSFYKPSARKELSEAIRRTMREHAPFDLELEYVTALGNERWVRAMGQVEVLDGVPARVFGTVQDVTEKKLNESRIWQAAHHDALTGLPNRKLFIKGVTACLSRSAQTGVPAALLVVDLDDFKLVNDTHGHDAGDAVLNVQSARMRAALRERDVLARLGGDEFAVLLAEVEDERQAEAISRRILAALREPVLWDGKLLECSGSVGIALFPQHGLECGDLSKSADLALYKAKAEGRHGCATFDSSLLRARENHVKVLACVRSAIADDRVMPFYQPIIEIASGRVSGFEALMRWEHPQRGLQLPGAVASAFDDPDVGCALGDRMRLRVMQDMRRWREMGVDFGRVGLNVGEPEFQRGGLGERILRDLEDHGLSPHQLVVEVTENALLSRSAGRARDALNSLRAAGIHVALDDFGTGTSSLTHLQQLPVGAIKVDRSFVAGVLTDPRSAAIVSAIVTLSTQLQFDSIAEGVESEEQLAFLRRAGCVRAQGFLFSKAIAGADVPAFLQRWRGQRDAATPLRLVSVM